MTIYAELLGAAESVGYVRTHPHPLRHLAAVVRAINDLSDADWDRLTESTQAWHVEAANVLNLGGTLANCPGFEETEPEAPPPAAIPAAIEESPAVLSDPLPGEPRPKKPRIRKPRPPKPKVTDRQRAAGIAQAIRRLVVERPDWSLDQLRAQLAEDGWAPELIKEGTLFTVHYNTQAVIGAARELGRWIDPDGIRSDRLESVSPEHK